jgi:hypothetical protein
MRIWILLFMALSLAGCYEKTTCCLKDAGCDAATDEDADADATAEVKNLEEKK